MTITLADAADWTVTESAHYNGGKEWFGYGYTCVQQPRLYRLDKYLKKDRTVTSTWSVDGKDCADLTEAVERLNVDPVIGDDERAMLASLLPAFQPLARVREAEPYTTLTDAPSVLHHWLRRKGLVEAQNGHVRRTELGDRILAGAA